MDWYPWFPLAFRHKTYHLSLAQDGAYRRLIDEYMLTRRPLPDNDMALARILGIGLDEWLTVATAVRQFFRPSSGLLFHKRCDQELRAQNTRWERFSERGKKAAFAKYSKINGKPPRRMLVPTTVQYKESYTNSDSETCAMQPQAVGEKERKSDASPELAASLRRKGWA
jgi:uncharacterized protein YdaU (DUF1376 family)